MSYQGYGFEPGTVLIVKKQHQFDNIEDPIAIWIADNTVFFPISQEKWTYSYPSNRRNGWLGTWEVLCIP